MPTRTKDLLARDAFLNIVRLHEKLTAQFTELFRAHDLTLAQYNVLRILIGGPEEGAPCQYVGERLLNRVPDVTRLIDRMQSAGLVKRSRSAEDRRVVLVRVTAKGRRLCESLHEPVIELHKRQLGKLPTSDLEQLDRVLQRALEL